MICHLRHLHAVVAVLSLLAVTGLATGAAGAEEGRAAVPVHVGGDARVDACEHIGHIVGAEPGGIGVTVRSAPDASATPVEEIARDEVVAMCEERAGWWGIVYGGDREACGVTVHLEEARPYEGRCRSGWVEDHRVAFLGG